jgi:hypothetical protein
MSSNLFQPEEPGATFLRSKEELESKQRINVSAWGLGSTDRWAVDLDEGVIRFSNDGGLIVTADVQVVGTYDTKDGTWLWGWDHPSIDEKLACAARLVRKFGEKYNLSHFGVPYIKCSPDDAFWFTALALHLWKGAGSYRGPSDATYVYMVFGPVTIHNTN